MNNLNDSIFGEIKVNYLNLSTIALYPKHYEDLKQRMIAESSQISVRKSQLVFKVIRREDDKLQMPYLRGKRTFLEELSFLQ